MRPLSSPRRFGSEDAWPFALRVSQLASCRAFLERQGSGPRVLRIFGPSGAGKSFFVRELMVQTAAEQKDGLGLYVDVPPSDLEAAALLERLGLLLGERREASREAPSFVGSKAARDWASVRRGRNAKRVSYFYLALRDLVAQIPVLGPFIKALLPQSAPGKAIGNGSASPMRFLVRRSMSRPVFLAIDNVQFLPSALRETLTVELAEAGPHLRLLLIERVSGRSRLSWVPNRRAELMDLDLENASMDDVTKLVKEVLSEAEDLQQVASTVFRRSDGNLKSVWFQLRLIASRREDQDALPTSYEDVILTLPPLDQAVLRFIVFTIGGLTVANLASLLQATDLHLRADAVTNAIADLSMLGLLVVNGDRGDRVRVEHELVAQVVTDITPEDEKLELHAQAVAALSAVLDGGTAPTDAPVLYDRLLGVVTGAELRQTPALLSHVVRFIQLQSEQERHVYLASICRDSVCWDVLDALPDTTVRSLLDAIQKSALFSFGLVATTRLRRSCDSHEALASLYEAKYLVQLFRYDEAESALERVPDSNEKRTVAYNVMLNLAQDDRAAEIAMEVYREVSQRTGTDHDYLVLRNSGHLFAPGEARLLVTASIDGFRALGRRFGMATAHNNLGIVDLASGWLGEARDRFEAARRQLAELDSPEVYQPLVNLSAVALLKGDVSTARQLLSVARDAAPSSLMQDSAMFDLNEVALDICASDRLGIDIVERVLAAARAARQTRDLRFIDVVTWFAECVERGAPTAHSRRRIKEIRADERVPLELFVPKRIGAAEIEVPFVLSPHWRY